MFSIANCPRDHVSYGQEVILMARYRVCILLYSVTKNGVEIEIKKYTVDLVD
jgi:hypothetical protein